jgi:nucleoside 2-deoxyribosyltransferase
MSIVYLAGPIDAGEPEGFRCWRDHAAGLLASQGITAYVPNGAFIAGNPPTARACEQIIKVNDFALTQSDVVLACLAGKSFGTPIECKTAFDARIPIFGFGGNERSIYLHWMVDHCDDVTEACEGVLRHLIPEYRSTIDS